MSETAEITCPYCGERIWMEAEAADGAVQEFVVDCEVCCRPIRYRCRFDEEGNLSIDARRGDE